MDHLPLGKPYPVSPVIRGARFILLFAGIIYGGIKQRRYQGLEEIWREEEAKRKIIRDKQHAILRAQIAKEERETVKLLETGKLFDPPGDLLADKKTKPKGPCTKPKEPCSCEDE